MNYIYFGNRIERSPLGNMGLQLLEAQEKLVSQEYEVENLRIKAAMYKAYFFRNSILAEKLQKQSEENRDALIGEFDGFHMQVGELMLYIERLKICAMKDY
jgi:hypothetical protein